MSDHLITAFPKTPKTPGTGDFLIAANALSSHLNKAQSTAPFLKNTALPPDGDWEIAGPRSCRNTPRRCAATMMAMLVLAVSAPAQDAPLDHRIDFPAGDAAWSVRAGKADAKPGDLTAPQPEPPAANSANPQDPAADQDQVREVRQIDIVRKGGLRRDQVRWTDGTMTEYWWSASSPIVVFQTKASEKVRAMKASQMGTRRFDDTLFSWVNATTFRRPEGYRGKKCLYYNYEMPLVDGETLTIHAWIDAKTHRPWAWSDGTTVALFQFDLPVPEEPLSIPPDFAQTLQRYEAFYAPPKRLGRK